MYDGLILAYSTATGEPHFVPEHWLTDEALSKDFTTTPPKGPKSTKTPDEKTSADKTPA